MQVNAINQFTNVNFEGKKSKKSQAPQAELPAEMPTQKKGFMRKLSGPVAAAMFMVPVVTTTLPSCEKIDISASADATVNFTPGDSCNHDHDCDCDRDTTVVRDTVVVRDSIFIPPAFEFPTQIQDSLNIWRGDILDVPVEGDDGDLTNKALLYLAGKRDWENDRPEYIKLNLERCYDDEARYDHVIDDKIVNDIRVTLVEPGEVTVVKQDGTVTDEVSGLMFNEDGYKTFAHSNGKDKIFVYPKAMDGENRGKYVELGTVEPGYLPEDGGTPDSKYGKNVLLYNILGDYMEDHYVNVEGKVMSVDELREMAQQKQSKIMIED